MGAYKNIDVSGTSKNTAPASSAAAITHFRIVTSGDVPKTNFIQLTSGGSPVTRNVALDGMLNVADAGIVIRLGSQGAAVVNELANTELVAMLDARFPTGASTDKIQWSENGTSASSKIAATNVDAWAAASDWT